METIEHDEVRCGSADGPYCMDCLSYMAEDAEADDQREEEGS